MLWRPADGFAGAAREIAAQLGPGDVAWIDALARRRGGPSETVELACVFAVAGPERRFDCAAASARLRGFVGEGGAGRIDALAVDGSRRSEASPTSRRGCRTGGGWRT